MPLVAPPTPDALRPTAEQALAAWAVRVRADREQVERAREVADPADFYAPVADRFRLDPRRTDDPVLDVLRSMARADETWLDIGAGGGRFALPLALVVREVVAVEPSDGMLAVLRDGIGELGVDNIRIVQARWPVTSKDGPASGVSGDVSLLAHVGYDIESIGPFLDAMEAMTARRCVAVMGQAAMTTVASRFWRPIHGEERAPLPALPELLALLMARGCLPEVELVERRTPTFASYDELLAMTRRQLWVRAGSERDRRLEQLVREAAVERDGRWMLDDRPASIGIVSWAPRASNSRG